jgi:hypothetical protein
MINFVNFRQQETQLGIGKGQNVLSLACPDVRGRWLSNRIAFHTKDVLSTFSIAFTS